MSCHKLCVYVSGGFESSSGGRRSDGLKGEKHRDRRDFGDVGGKLAASDEDDDRHRSSRGSRQSHKSSGQQQGDLLTAYLILYYVSCPANSPVKSGGVLNLSTKICRHAWHAPGIQYHTV